LATIIRLWSVTVDSPDEIGIWLVERDRRVKRNFNTLMHTDYYRVSPDSPSSSTQLVDVSAKSIVDAAV